MTENTGNFWCPASSTPLFYPQQLKQGVLQFRKTTHVLRDRQNGHLGIGIEGGVATSSASNDAFEVIATLPPLFPEWLGDRTFSETHGTRFPYVGGAMANGITTVRMVRELAEAGMLGFFGAAGLPAHQVLAAITELKSTLDARGLPWGSNLIHSPNEPILEDAVTDLYIRENVRRVSASAYMQLSESVVRYACTGLSLDANGAIVRENHLFAKISRPETAEHFMRPAPKKILDALVAKGQLTQEEANLARQIPVSEALTVEADSGGHTDRQALSAIFPTISMLRDKIVAEYDYQRPIRLGAGGGLGSPSAIAAAFTMGAAYVLTGTVNQACIESGLHESGRRSLAQAKTGDVTMTPASDMFEIGVKLQVLKRGTMYPSRAAKLYDLYTTYKSIEEIPADIKLNIEKSTFKATLEETWLETEKFWAKRDPTQIEKAARDSRHKMALIFRSYLGLSSRWAIIGDKERVLDYQIWCGPAIAAFNLWTEDTFLQNYEDRTVVQVALNLLEGAAAITRAYQLRTYGVPLASTSFDFRPRLLN